MIAMLRFVLRASRANSWTATTWYTVTAFDTYHCVTLFLISHSPLRARISVADHQKQPMYVVCLICCLQICNSCSTHHQGPYTTQTIEYRHEKCMHTYMKSDNIILFRYWSHYLTQLSLFIYLLFTYYFSLFISRLFSIDYMWHFKTEYIHQ